MPPGTSGHAITVIEDPVDSLCACREPAENDRPRELGVHSALRIGVRRGTIRRVSTRMLGERA
jgi:hypothetical protein